MPAQQRRSACQQGQQVVPDGQLRWHPLWPACPAMRAQQGQMLQAAEQEAQCRCGAAAPVLPAWLPSCQAAQQLGVAGARSVAPPCRTLAGPLLRCSHHQTRLPPAQQPQSAWTVLWRPCKMVMRSRMRKPIPWRGPTAPQRPALPTAPHCLSCIRAHQVLERWASATMPAAAAAAAAVAAAAVSREMIASAHA